jgi:predicted flap endonuclease-1-like 5' DNA nuclease
MNYLLLQTFLLLLASYFLGAFLACLVKRAVVGSHAEVSEGVLAPVEIEMPIRPPAVMPPQPARTRVAQPIAPRAIDPVQPKIDVLRRPDPRPAPRVLDPSRFERALMGPDPNEGVPRRAIVEVRPSVLKPVTGIYKRPPAPVVPPPPLVAEPPPPPPPQPAEEAAPLPEPEIAAKPERTGGLAARLRDATTAAAAGAVAAAKAAAAASVSMPSVLSSRSAPVEPKPEPEPEREPSPEPEVVDEITPSAPAEIPAAPPEPAAPPVAVATPAPVAEKPVEPKPEIKAAPVAQAPIEGGDDFQRIRAIDAVLEQKLKAAGVNYFEDVAQWTSADVKRIGQELGIPGRIDREQWVEQAQILAKGGDTYYSRNRKSAFKSSAPSAPSANKTGAERQPKLGGTEVAALASASVGEEQQSDLSGVAAASQGRSVAEMAAAAAAAIAAASASVTRGLKPIEPISPLAKVDPKISMPARITDAIRDKGSTAAATVAITREGVRPAVAGAVATEGPQDDLKRIRGIGVLIEKRLNALGIGRYEQIANWTSGDIDRVSRSLEFKGRIERENWVEQARILASGGQTEFSRRVDRGEVDTSRDA